MNCLLSTLTHPEVQWFSIFYRSLVLVGACPFVKKARHPSLSILYPLSTLQRTQEEDSPNLHNSYFFCIYKQICSKKPLLPSLLDQSVPLVTVTSFVSLLRKQVRQTLKLFHENPFKLQ